MGVVQRTGVGSKPCNSRVVSKSDKDHRTGYYGHITIGLTPAGTICHSTCSLCHYPIHRWGDFSSLLPIFSKQIVENAEKNKV